RRRHHSKREVSKHKYPEPAPVTRYLPKACAELVDTHNTVDREIRRENITNGLHRFGDRFARPGEAGQEELRQAGTEENERRRFGMLEPGSEGLAHKAGR